MRCADCHWFYYASSTVRLSKSCEELGEKPSNRTCDAFTTKNNELFMKEGIPRLPLKELSVDDVKAGLGALDNIEYSVIFKEIAAEQFVLRQDAYRSMMEVSAILQQQGARVDFDQRNFDRYINKLSDIFMLYRLVLVFGLGPYADHIVANEIDKQFSPTKPVATTRPTRTTTDDNQ